MSCTIAQAQKHPTLLPPEHEHGQPPGTDVPAEITVRNKERKLLEDFLTSKCFQLRCEGAVFSRAHQLLRGVVQRQKRNSQLVLDPTCVGQQQASERAMRVGCTYWVVMDHHAVQQSGQGVETTYIQTWEGDKNAAHSEPAPLLLGCEMVEMQREKSLGPSIQNKAAVSQEREPDWQT